LRLQPPLTIAPLFFVQECFGPAVPETGFGFVSRDASCNSNTVETSVSHALQLGIHCDSTTQGEFVFYGDLFVDCVDETAEFDFMDGTGATEGITEFRYTCSKSVTFPAASTSSQTQIIPFLGISTDLYWARNPDEACYQIGDTEPAPSAPVPTPPAASPSSLRAPTLSPTATKSVLVTPSPTTVNTVVVTPVPVELLTSSPILAPQAVPLPSPGSVLTLSPALAPVAAPLGGTAPTVISPPVTVPTDRGFLSDSGSAVGVAVGASVAVLVVLVMAGVIVFWCLRRKSDGSSAASSTGDKQPITVNAAPPAHGGATDHDYTEPEGDMGHHSGASGPTYYSNSAANTSQQEEAEIDLGHQQPPVAVYGEQPVYHQPPQQQQQYSNNQQYMQAQQPHPYAVPLQPMVHAYAPQDPHPSHSTFRSSHPYAQQQQPYYGEDDHHLSGSGGGGVSVASGHSGPHASIASAHTAASSPTTTSQHSGRSAQTNTRPVEFKDQARSVVYEVPMTDVQPVVAEAVAMPFNPPTYQQQVMDSSLMSSGTTGTGGSNRSDPDGRRSVDP
jgi:hypothetical protein